MFSLPDAVRFLGARLERTDLLRPIRGAAIDTRTIVQGNLFVALKGAAQDGHAYLEDAFRKGASGALIQKTIFDSAPGKFLDPDKPFRNLMIVENPQRSLADLARWYRGQFQIRVAGVTGSVGKTSTKEFLNFILRRKAPVLATVGNFNNHLGLPLTLLGLDSTHRFCVAELGANHPGEIAFLSTILKQDAAILTQVAPVHLEGFGTLEGVRRAKLEIFEALPSGAPAVIPDDDPDLARDASKLKVKLLRVGTTLGADIPVTEIRSENGWVSFLFGGRRFSFPGTAKFLARNAAMALALGEELGVSLAEIPERWEGFELPKGRFQEKMIGDGIRVIDDGYNANPVSFAKALETFSELQTNGRKFLVFADMLELGGEEKKYHEELGRNIASSGIDYAVGYGDRARWTAAAARKENGALEVDHVGSAGAAVQTLIPRLSPGDVVLLKGSRGMKVEDVVKGLEAILLNTSLKS